MRVTCCTCRCCSLLLADQLCLGVHHHWRCQGSGREHDQCRGHQPGYDLCCRLCFVLPVLPGTRRCSEAAQIDRETDTSGSEASREVVGFAGEGMLALLASLLGFLCGKGEVPVDPLLALRGLSCLSGCLGHSQPTVDDDGQACQ